MLLPSHNVGDRAVGNEKHEEQGEHDSDGHWSDPLGIIVRGLMILPHRTRPASVAVPRDHDRALASHPTLHPVEASAIRPGLIGRACRHPLTRAQLKAFSFRGVPDVNGRTVASVHLRLLVSDNVGCHVLNVSGQPSAVKPHHRQ